MTNALVRGHTPSRAPLPPTHPAVPRGRRADCRPGPHRTRTAQRAPTTAPSSAGRHAGGGEHGPAWVTASHPQSCPHRGRTLLPAPAPCGSQVRTDEPPREEGPAPGRTVPWPRSLTPLTHARPRRARMSTPSSLLGAVRLKHSSRHNSGGHNRREHLTEGPGSGRGDAQNTLVPQNGRSAETPPPRPPERGRRRERLGCLTPPRGALPAAHGSHHSRRAHCSHHSRRACAGSHRGARSPGGGTQALGPLRALRWLLRPRPSAPTPPVRTRTCRGLASSPSAPGGQVPTTLPGCFTSTRRPHEDGRCRPDGMPALPGASPQQPHVLKP